MSLRAAPIGLAEANRFVERLHRHHGQLPAARFSIAAINDETGDVHGVAVAGRPKARMLDDGGTLEVNRVCTDGTENCCSFLYGSCKRAAKALGYARLLTYTLPSESGASLRASGWTNDGEAGGGAWSRKNRPQTGASGGVKLRWWIDLADPLPPLVWPEMPPHVDQLSMEAA